MQGKPILFNTEMVRAILNNRKTATRRIMKPPPPPTSYVSSSPCGVVWAFWRDGDDHILRAPYQPGDILYVRETWKQAVSDPVGGGYGITDFYVYKADVPQKTDGTLVEERRHPSIHMPKKAARLFLRVIDVRVERLRNITAEQCVAEGVGADYVLEDMGGEFVRGMYADLWDSTIKKSDLPHYGWDANPWVWVVEFERYTTIPRRRKSDEL